MKFSCIQENLKHGLHLVGNVTHRNVNLPILNNVLINVENGQIHLSATNLEIGIHCTIRGKVENEGAFTVESKLLSNYINLLPKERIDLELLDQELSVICKNNKTKIKGLLATDFPLIPKVKKENAFICDANDFRQSLSQVIFAAAPNESRPEISGVYLAFRENQVIATATDSYRLAEKKFPQLSQSNSQEKEIIVPVRTLQEVLRVLTSFKDGLVDSTDLEIYLEQGQILFVYNGVEVVSRLIEGQYPDYRQIIPQSQMTSIILPVSELVNATKSASLFSDPGINEVTLEFFPNQDNDPLNSQIKVTGSNNQIGENISILNAHITGEQNRITLNHNFLVDGLNNIETKNVQINIIDSSSPGVLRPVGNVDNSGEKDDVSGDKMAGSYLHIIMPIRQ